MKRLFQAIAVAGFFVSTPVVAQDVDPVGTYEWEADAGGQYVYGTFEIEKAEEGWAGKAGTDEGVLALARIEVAGSIVSFTVNSPSMGEVYVELRIQEERVTGFASVGGEQVPMSGTKSD